MRSSIRLAAGGVVLAASLTLPAVAQEPAEPDTAVVSLDELVVTATRAERAVRDIPANVTVVSRAFIETSSAQTVPDVLRLVPGFTMRDHQSNLVAHPTRQGASLRGMTGTTASRTLVLVDGVPLADPIGGWIHWSRVPLELVERIEVVRGGVSGVWGNQALGGVINIITRDSDRSDFRARLEGGTLSTIRTGGSGSWSGDGIGLTLAGEYFDTGGYETVREDLRGPIDIDVTSTSRALYGKLRVDASPTVGLDLDASYLDEDRKNGTEFRDVTLSLGAVRAGVDVGLGFGTLSGVGFLQSVAHTNRFSSEALDRASETPSLDQFDVPGLSLGGQLQLVGGGGAHRWTLGTDVQSVDGEINERFLWTGDEFARQRTLGGTTLLAGLYAGDLIQLSPRLELTTNARVDLWRNTDGRRRDREIASRDVLVDEMFPDRTEWAFNWGLGLRFHASETVSWRANAYRGFRAPTLNELYKPFRAPGNVVADANAALEAERVLGAEVGVDLAVGAAGVARGTLFWNRVDDPIVDVTIEEAGPDARPIEPCGFVPAGGVCLQRQNLGRFRTAGLEAELELRPLSGLLVSGTYTFNPTEVTSAPAQPDLVGNRNKGAARHQFAMRAAWSGGAFVDAALTGRYVGSRFEDDANDLGLDDFFVLDARIGRRLDRRWELFVEAENLLDTRFEVSRSTTGLVRVGGPRWIHGGVRVRLR